LGTEQKANMVVGFAAANFYESLYSGAGLSFRSRHGALPECMTLVFCVWLAAANARFFGSAICAWPAT
jgi:hypothetical protein